MSDVTYLFGQVGTVRAEVDYNLNCGNLTAAVGMYAIQEGFVAPTEGTTVVRVHNVNTDRIVRVEVPVQAGDIDLVVRQFASGSASKTLAATLTATTGLACCLAGTLPHRMLGTRDGRLGLPLAFGHPSGVIHVEAALAGGQVQRLALLRTARRLAEGRVYLKAPFTAG